MGHTRCCIPTCMHICLYMLLTWYQRETGVKLNLNFTPVFLFDTIHPHFWREVLLYCTQWSFSHPDRNRVKFGTSFIGLYGCHKVLPWCSLGLKLIGLVPTQIKVPLGRLDAPAWATGQNLSTYLMKLHISLPSQHPYHWYQKIWNYLHFMEGLPQDGAKNWICSHV